LLGSFLQHSTTKHLKNWNNLLLTDDFSRFALAYFTSSDKMKAKYLNPFTDFGFKKIFREEASKPLLLDFLNALLPQNEKIVDLTFKNNEQLGQTDLD
jgi:hypothetical protein